MTSGSYVVREVTGGPVRSLRVMNDRNPHAPYESIVNVFLPADGPAYLGVDVGSVQSADHAEALGLAFDRAAEIMREER